MLGYYRHSGIDIFCREFNNLAVRIEIATSDPGRPDSEIGNSIPLLMIDALWVNGEVKFLQTRELGAGGLIGDPLVLHSNFLIPSHDSANPWMSPKISTFSRRAECIEDDLQLLSDGNTD